MAFFSSFSSPFLFFSLLLQLAVFVVIVVALLSQSFVSLLVYACDLSETSEWKENRLRTIWMGKKEVSMALFTLPRIKTSDDGGGVGRRFFSNGTSNRAFFHSFIHLFIHFHFPCPRDSSTAKKIDCVACNSCRALSNSLLQLINGLNDRRDKHFTLKPSREFYERFRIMILTNTPEFNEKQKSFGSLFFHFFVNKLLTLDLAINLTTIPKKCKLIFHKWKKTNGLRLEIRHWPSRQRSFNSIIPSGFVYVFRGLWGSLLLRIDLNCSSIYLNSWRWIQFFQFIGCNAALFLFCWFFRRFWKTPEFLRGKTQFL